MDIFESLENLSISEECFNDIISIVEEYINELSNKNYTIPEYAVKEDYESFKDEKEQEASPQSYQDLITVNNSIRRNKAKALKDAQREYRIATKEELADRKGKNIHAHFLSLNKVKDALSAVQKAREEEKEAYKEVEKARKGKERAEYLKDKYGMDG